MIEIKKLYKSFENLKNEKTEVLKNINIKFPTYGLSFIVGKSGSGKTTLMSILGGLLTPTSGSITINDYKIDFDNREELSKYRREEISYVFQEYNLLEDFSVLENLELSGCKDSDELDKILEDIDLKNKINSNVKLLSGGEKQRLAIGRALAKRSPIILLDEPTGNLDENNSRNIFEILKKISISRTVIVVTHDLTSVLEYGDFAVTIKDGQVKTKMYPKQRTFEFEVGNKIPDTIIEIGDYIKKYIDKNKVSFSIKQNENPKRMVLEKGKVLDALIREIKKYSGQVIQLEINIDDNEVKEKIETKVKKPYISDFPLKRQVEYSFKLIRKKLSRNIFTILTFSLCLVLVIFHTSILLYDTSAGVNRALKVNDIQNADITETRTNENLDVYVTTKTGETLYNDIEKAGNTPIPVFDSSIDEVNSFNLEVIDKPLNYYGENIQVPLEDKIVITSFLSSIINNETSCDVRIEYSNIQNMEVEQVVDIPYSNDLMVDYLSNNYSISESELLNNKYLCAFISKSTYIKYKKSTSEFVEYSPAVSKTGRDSVFSSYTFYPKYSRFTDQTLFAGNMPQSKNEIAVSQSFFNKVLKVANSNLENYSDCIGETLYYKDLISSPNHVSYAGDINLYDISNSVVITGVVTDNSVSELTLYLNDDFYNSYCEQTYYFGDSIKTDVSNIQNIQNILDYNLTIYSYSINDVIMLSVMLKGSLSTVFIVLETILFAISLLLLILTCNINVRDKFKEIAILKSMGIEKKKINNVFLIQNLFVTLSSFVIGAILANAFDALLNNILMKKTVLNISYILLPLHGLSYVIVIPILLIICLVTTIFPMIQIKKIDLAVALKSF